jgi:Tat protein secretion system quality control protein TatD with DNase activity
VEYTTRKIAVIKNINFEKVAQTTVHNAQKLFGF